MKGHTDVTTYELPPEPPVGSRVTDKAGKTWTRVEFTASPWRDAARRWAWQDLLKDHGPVTLIEPDPWPTAQLIVATRGGPATRRGLFARWQTDEDYVDISGATSGDGDDLAIPTRDTLTNVVPVTVVPTAEWESLVEKVRSFDAARTDRQWRVVVARAAELIVDATDALGLSQ